MVTSPPRAKSTIIGASQTFANVGVAGQGREEHHTEREIHHIHHGKLHHRKRPILPETSLVGRNGRYKRTRATLAALRRGAGPPRAPLTSLASAANMGRGAALPPYRNRHPARQPP